MKGTRVIVTLLALFLFAGCSPQGNVGEVPETSNELIDFGNEEGEIELVINALLESYTIEEASEYADVVAEVTIIDTLFEVDDTIPYTVLEVEVNQLFKGNTKEKFTIKQQGNSKAVVNAVSIFEKGNKYILFLKETGVVKSDYWIIGEESGMYQVVNDDLILKLLGDDEELREIEMKEDVKLSKSDIQTKLFNSGQLLYKQGLIEKIKSSLDE